MAAKKKIGLGDEVRDTVAGFRGIVTARAEYLFGKGPQCLVVAETRQSASDERWLPEARLEHAAEKGAGFTS